MITGHWAEMKKWAAVKWSFYRLAALTHLCLAATFGFYLVGYSLSDECSSENLARSGAAATALLILLTLYNSEDRVRKSQQAASIAFQKATDHMENTGTQSQERIDAQLTKNTNRVLRWIKIPNALGLALATLVWGFGDLVNNCPCKF